MPELSIIPECYTDTSLIEVLLPPSKGYNHQKGCNNVVNVMTGKLKDQFAVGIVDKDKREIGYLKQFQPIANTGSLFLYKHPDKPHYIIQISPAIEAFILQCADEKKIPLENYDLPSEIKELTKRTKQIVSKKDPTLKKLFKMFKDSQECIILKKWIEHLITYTYKSDIQLLKQIAAK
ncbi:MAG: hypothetical protein LBQ84_05570 [Flavobacteriaceae bacterium]|jgi:antitoxin component of RelBE/YafQ-DinJ toxin-antitoxin module|nr:hypothetical protein [Flavobacteriaceae bacterium]